MIWRMSNREAFSSGSASRTLTKKKRIHYVTTFWLRGSSVVLIFSSHSLASCWVGDPDRLLTFVQQIQNIASNVSVSLRLIEMVEVTNYTHLFGVFKCYPFAPQLSIHFSKVKADLVVIKHQVHSYGPCCSPRQHICLSDCETKLALQQASRTFSDQMNLLIANNQMILNFKSA